jgi:protein-serine/threonine kinase
MSDNEKVIVAGYVSIKEGGMRSFLWTKRWMQLREQIVTIHKNEV